MTTSLLKVRNPAEALESGLWLLRGAGIMEASRNGRVLVAPGPVITEYSEPRERLLMDRLRDANPFFHLFEAIWMLAGRRDVKFVSQFAEQISAYSDNGEVFHGAYGHRWINHFEFDQLDAIMAELQIDPTSRRIVLSMWDPKADLELSQKGKKDLPCNTHAYFGVRDGALNMTVCNRSNDMVWGAYGANAFHFSFLQEFMSLAMSLRTGTYCQISNNFHAYIDRPDVRRLFMWSDATPAAIITGVRYGVAAQPFPHGLARPLLESGESAADFIEDCRWFCSAEAADYDMDEHSTVFFREVAGPMRMVHAAYKAGDMGTMLAALSLITDPAYTRAALFWLIQRKACASVVDTLQSVLYRKELV